MICNAFFQEIRENPKSLILQLFPRFRTFSPALSVQSVQNPCRAKPALFYLACIFLFALPFYMCI